MADSPFDENMNDLQQNTFFDSTNVTPMGNNDDNNQNEDTIEPKQESKENDDESDVSIGSLFGSDDDGNNKQILSKEYIRSVPEGKKISISTNLNTSSLPSSEQFEFCVMRLPNVIGCDTEPFDERTYVEPSALGSSSGVDNYIRWRTHYEVATDETFKESNTKLVYWKDGTKSLFIGKDCYDIEEQRLVGNRDYLYAKLPNGTSTESFKLCHGKFVKKLNVRTNRKQQSYQTLQNNLAKKHQRTKGSKQLSAAQLRRGNRSTKGGGNNNRKRKVNKKRNVREEQGGYGNNDSDDGDYYQKNRKQDSSTEQSSEASSDEDDDDDEESTDDDDDVAIGARVKNY